jgi:DNA-binding transcriptional LysR family regulator
MPAAGEGFAMFSSDDLHLIEALARTGKLAAAARELRLDPSTVYRRLAALEKRAGARLFDRGAAGYRTTHQGQRMAEFAGRWLVELDALHRLVRGAPGQVGGTVRITTTEDLALAVLPAALARIARAHPSLQMQVFVDNQLRDLQRHEADVALRPTREPPLGLVGKDLGALPTAVYARRERARGAPPPAWQAVVAASTWIDRVDAAGPSRDHRWMRAHVADSQVIARFSSFSAYLAAARAGVGLALLPCVIGDADAALVRLGEPLRELTSRLWVLCSAELRRDPAVRAVFQGLGVNRL